MILTSGIVMGEGECPSETSDCTAILAQHHVPNSKKEIDSRPNIHEPEQQRTQEDKKTITKPASKRVRFSA